jgi:hypothetical protein
LDLKQQIARLTELEENRKLQVRRRVEKSSKTIADLKNELCQKTQYSNSLSNRIQRYVGILKEKRTDNKQLRYEYAKACATTALLEARRKYEGARIEELEQSAEQHLEREKSSVDDARDLLGQGLAEYQNSRNESYSSNKCADIEFEKFLKDFKLKLDTIDRFHKQLKEKMRAQCNLLVEKDRLDGTDKNDHKSMVHAAILSMTNQVAKTRLLPIIKSSMFILLSFP